eukprot:3939307-Rhodomonas_salina.2
MPGRCRAGGVTWRRSAHWQGTRERQSVGGRGEQRGWQASRRVTQAAPSLPPPPFLPPTRLSGLTARG